VTATKAEKPHITIPAASQVSTTFTLYGAKRLLCLPGTGRERGEGS
jgi:hypothetical protein